MKKILIVTQVIDREDPLLGFFVKWVEAFANQATQVTVICLRKGVYDLPANVKVLSLGKEEGQSKIKYLSRFFVYIWKERNNYDSVFVHMNQVYVILAGIVWRVLGKKISLWYAHGKVSNSLRIAEKLTHICFASTPAGFKLKTKKLHIVGQGIDTAFFNSSPDVLPNPSEVRLITIGRISPVKRIMESLVTLYEMRQQYPMLKYDVIGVPGLGSQEVYYRDCLAYIKSCGLEGDVRFLGGMSQEEILPRLQASNIFLNISETGSLDKAILEAMSVGLLVISSNESFRQILPADLEWLGILPDLSNLKCALKKAISLTAKEKEFITERLRTIVIKDHGLNNLISKILMVI